VISAFGERAEAFAEGLGDLEAVIADTTMLGRAYLEAVRRRELGGAFYGMVLYEEPRAQTTLGYAWQVLAQVTGFDARRAALDLLGAGELILGTQPARALWTTPVASKQIVNEFLSLANGMLVRSYAEATRLNALAARPRSIEPVLSVPRVPAVRPRLGVRPGVVIWAPDRAASFVTWYAFALAEFFGDVTCVTAGGEVPTELPARFISPLDPELGEILAAAQCVLCAEPDDPGAAVAFARAGFGVAAPLASGAQEYVRDIVSFGLTQQREVEIAVKIAIGRPASIRAVPQPLPAPTVPALPLAAADLPLVSIVVCTYNRPADLALCLRDLAKQTYPCIEIVVVNDAGENVDHIVAPYANARIVNLPVNGGVERLVIEAFKIIKGSYVQLLADDDTLFPDHVERLMAAMLRSGACIVHGNTLMRYERREDDGSLSLSGYNAIVFNDSTTPTEALIATPIAGQSLIIRRDIIDGAGGYSRQTALADQEFQLRLAGRYVFAYVDALTNEWRIRGGENFSSRTDGGAELRKVYEELHPLPGRPLIEQRRRATLEAMAARPKGYIFEPTVRVRSSGTT
jgi:hypothetical protein